MSGKSKKSSKKLKYFVPDDEELFQKPKSTSEVWQFFGIRQINGYLDTSNGICRLCRVIISAKSGNTSNLTYHLDHSHPGVRNSTSNGNKRKDDEDICPSSSKRPKIGKQPKIGKRPKIAQASAAACSTSSGSAVHKEDSAEFRNRVDAIGKFIVSAGLPINVIETSGFRHMLKVFDKRFECPKRSFFSKNIIPALFSEKRSQIQQIFEKEVKYFSATTYLWSDSYTVTSYLGCTVHFISSDWKYESKSLGILHTPEVQTVETLDHAIKDLFHDWSLNPALHVCTTTDNGSNLAKSYNHTRLPCFGHNLHLAINEGMKDPSIEQTVNLIRQGVSYVLNSFSRLEELKGQQRAHGLPEKRLILDSETLWGSKFRMLLRYNENLPALNSIFVNYGKPGLLLNNNEKNVLSTVIDVLTPLHTFTDALASEGDVSISKLLPTIKHLECLLSENSATDSSLHMEIKQRIKAHLLSYYNDEGIQDLLNLCAYFDPRSRNCYCNVYKAVSRIKAEISSLEFIPEKKTPAAVFRESASVNNKQAPTTKLSEILFKISQHQTTESNLSATYLDSHAEIVDECSLYNKLNVGYDEDDVLSFWKNHETSLPLLSLFARKYLCVRSTSEPCERLFSQHSQHSHAACKERNRPLKPDLLSKLAFLEMNSV